MRFNRLTLQNDPITPIYSGLVTQVLASPQVGEEDFVYIVDDNQFVKKIQVSTASVVQTYNPLTDVIPPGTVALYRDWDLRSIDFYFEDTTKLLVTYDSYLIADNTRKTTLITYNLLNLPVGVYFIITLAKPFRTAGAVTVRHNGPTNDLIAISGPFIVHYDITPSNPSKPQFLIESSSNTYSGASSNNVKYSDKLAITKIYKEGVPGTRADIAVDFSRFQINAIYNPDLALAEVQSLADFRVYDSQITNCYNEITTEGDVWCFGNIFYRFNLDQRNVGTSGNWARTFDLKVREYSSGVGIRKSGTSTYYILSNENTLLRMNSDTCYSNENSMLAQVRIFSAPPSCLKYKIL